jgi:hypothetical protein
MALYRFLFAPVLLAVAVWAGPRDPHAAPDRAPPAAAARPPAAAARPPAAPAGAPGAAAAKPAPPAGLQR